MKKQIGYKILSAKSLEELIEKVKNAAKKQEGTLIYIPLGNVIIDDSRIIYQTVIAYEAQEEVLLDYLIIKEHSPAALEQNVCKKLKEGWQIPTPATVDNLCYPHQCLIKLKEKTSFLTSFKKLISKKRISEF